jgi:hypothetical protein
MAAFMARTRGEVLAGVAMAGVSSDERIAQLLDLAAQVLEEARAQAAGAPVDTAALRASFGGHARFLEAAGSDPALVGLVHRLRHQRAGLDLRQPLPQALDALQDTVAGLVALTRSEGHPWVRRVRYGVEPVNQVTLESPWGPRAFELMHGSALAPEADVLVASSHADPDRAPDGQVVSALRWRWGMAVNDPGPFLRFPDGSGWVSWLPEVPPGAPFRGVLLLRTIAGADYDVEAYAAHLRCAFAALSALDYLGVPVRRVTLPMLAGNRLRDVDARATATLREVTRWLRGQAAASTVRAVVFFADELSAWSAAMDRCLGRSFLGPGHDAMLDGLQQDVLRRLSHPACAAIGSSVGSLRDLLSRPREQLPLHAVCVFGRKLVEELVARLSDSHGLRRHHELMKSIEELSRARAVSPWMASYMHGLRVLGNESVHLRDGEISWLPRELGPADLAMALAAIRALLEQWQARLGADGAAS